MWDVTSGRSLVIARSRAHFPWVVEGLFVLILHWERNDLSGKREPLFRKRAEKEKTEATIGKKKSDSF